MLKFDFFFFLGFTVQFLVIVKNTTTTEFYLTIVAVPITIVILFLAALCVRKENKPGMVVIIVSLLIESHPKSLRIDPTPIRFSTSLPWLTFSSNCSACTATTRPACQTISLTAALLPSSPSSPSSCSSSPSLTLSGVCTTSTKGSSRI